MKIANVKNTAKNIVQINIDCEGIVLCKFSDHFYMPEMKITVIFPEIMYINKEGKNITKERYTSVFWMSPFRDYKFQISGTINGDTDYGSTEVVGLQNMISAFNNNTKIVNEKSNVSYKSYIGTHSHISTHIIEYMIRACLTKFIEYPILFNKYDGIKINLGESKTINYSVGGFAILDPLSYFAEIVTTYLLIGMNRVDDIDAALIKEYWNNIPIYDINETKKAKSLIFDKEGKYPMEVLEKIDDNVELINIYEGVLAVRKNGSNA